MIGHTEWTVPVDDEGHFPSSSSITDRFPPPGLQNSRVTWRRNMLTFKFQLSTLLFQLSTSEDGSLTEQTGWWCQSSFFVDLASHLCSREMTKKFYNQVVHSQAVLLAWVFPNHNHRSDVVKVQNLKRKVVNVKIIAIPSPSPQRPTQARPRPDSPLCQRKVIFVFRISILTNHHRQNTNIQRGKALTTTIERPARRTYYDWHTAWQTQME